MWRLTAAVVAVLILAGCASTAGADRDAHRSAPTTPSPGTPVQAMAAALAFAAHDAHRTAFSRPSLDRTHQPRAHTSAPVRLRHTQRINVDPDFPQVAQHLALSILGRPLQACADVPDDLAVHLGHEPH